MRVMVMITALMVRMMPIVIVAVAQPWAATALGALVPAWGRNNDTANLMNGGMTRADTVWIGVISLTLKPIGSWMNLSAVFAAKFFQETLLSAVDTKT